MSTHKSWLYSSTNSCSTRSFGLLTYSYSTSRGRSCRWDVGGEENGAAAIDIFTQSPRLQVTHRLSVARWAFVCFRSKTEDEDASSHLRISLFDRCDNVTGFYLRVLYLLVLTYCKKVTVPGIMTLILVLVPKIRIILTGFQVEAVHCQPFSCVTRR